MIIFSSAYKTNYCSDIDLYWMHNSFKIGERMYLTQIACNLTECIINLCLDVIIA